LAAYLEETPEVIPAALVSDEFAEDQMAMRIGDLCPECGAATVVKEEGCSKCYSCGFSEC
jgi:ribonucleoside-diphosphate reductase alpha chain